MASDALTCRRLLDAALNQGATELFSFPQAGDNPTAMRWGKCRATIPGLGLLSVYG